MKALMQISWWQHAERMEFWILVAIEKLGRNQIRVATFPAIEPNDIETLTSSIDYLLESLI